MRMYDLIQKKKDGKALTQEEIDFMIDGYTKGDISNEQMSAFCMAVYFKGMNPDETSGLTMAMANSGDTVDLSGIDGFKVDKHSTGGVGDKTTFIVMSIVASLGIKVAKMSGRGLGHTGGTLDKIESIPGIQIEFHPDDFLRRVEEVGACLAGQTGELAPADKKLYALRDETATVDNLSLISASIMSKKIASGADGIVLDVKTGNGAFMKDFEDALKLAKEMVDIGERCGKKTAALITDMNAPIGYHIGNGLEMMEVIHVLKGVRLATDLIDLCIELSAHMIQLATDAPIETCREQAHRQLESGAALEKFGDIIAAQGGDTTCLDDPDVLETANIAAFVSAPKTGYITAMNTETLGLVSGMLGAGRQTADDVINNYGSGIKLTAKTGDFVEKNQMIAIFKTDDEAILDSAKALFLQGVEFGPEKPIKPPLIYARVTKENVEIYQNKD
ncbi:MAG: thymidine phosphorylase [Defluviitaleaceae bacterium]|nr:thymidine phosphorylase [Defluviitaleaceae bacterium]